MDAAAPSQLQKSLPWFSSSKLEAPDWVQGLANPAYARESTALLSSLIKGWRPISHWLYPIKFRTAVRTMLFCFERIGRLSASRTVAQNDVPKLLPHLPDEIVCFILSQLLRW